MDVGDEGDIDAFFDLREGGSIFLIQARKAHQAAAQSGAAINLGGDLVHAAGFDGRHRLDDDFLLAAKSQVPDADGAGLVS